MEGNASQSFTDNVPVLRQAANDEKTLRYIPVLVYIGILMFIGVFGNVLVLYVYRRRFKRTSSNYFILTMAVFDLIGCLVSMPTEIYDLTHSYTFFSSPACKISRFAEVFVNYGSTVVLVEIACDRYIKICHPMVEVSLLKVKLLCFLSVIISIVLSAPSPVFFGVTAVAIPGTNITGFDCSVETKYIRSTAHRAYTGVILMIMMAIWFSLAVLYIKIWLEIRRRKKMGISDQIVKPLNGKSKGECRRRKSKVKVKYIPSTDDDSNQCADSEQIPMSPIVKNMRSRLASISASAPRIHVSRTTIILFVVTVAFLVSYLPTIVVMVTSSVVKSSKHESAASDVLSKLFSRFFLMNNAINPVIYSLLNINFRREAKKLLKRAFCCQKSKMALTSSSFRSSTKAHFTKSSESPDAIASKSSRETLDAV